MCHYFVSTKDIGSRVGKFLTARKVRSPAVLVEYAVVVVVLCPTSVTKKLYIFG